MFGVILWSDTADQKAVIWCEDQGNLAFYSAGDNRNADCDVFTAGDLVQFDLREERHLRFARNPRLVAQEYSSSLAEDLVSLAHPQAVAQGRAQVKPQAKSQAHPAPRRPAATGSPEAMCNVVSLDAARQARDKYAYA